RIACFGDNGRGQLGLGDTAGHAGPAAVVALGAKATALAAGAHHACALLEGGRIACWGANDSGQLGAGDAEDRPRPVLIDLGSASARSVAARMASTCARLDDGRVECWGANGRGQLGLGDTASRPAPPASSVALGTGRSASALAVGGSFACALLDTSQAKCWGDNR